jgi:hypothetical protein
VSGVAGRGGMHRTGFGIPFFHSSLFLLTAFVIPTGIHHAAGIVIGLVTAGLWGA